MLHEKHGCVRHVGVGIFTERPRGSIGWSVIFTGFPPFFQFDLSLSYLCLFIYLFGILLGFTVSFLREGPRKTRLLRCLWQMLAQGHFGVRVLASCFPRPRSRIQVHATPPPHPNPHPHPTSLPPKAAGRNVHGGGGDSQGH